MQNQSSSLDSDNGSTSQAIEAQDTSIQLEITPLRRRSQSPSSGSDIQNPSIIQSPNPRVRRGSRRWSAGANPVPTGPLPKKTLQLVSDLARHSEERNPSWRRDLAIRQAELKEEQRLAAEEKRLKESLKTYGTKKDTAVQHASAIGSAHNPPPPLPDEFYHYAVKILLLGDAAVGKTSLMNRYSEDKFVPNLIATAGVDYKCRNIDIAGTRIRVQIWDTAGQEQFHSITRAYYKGAQGITLVYDVTDSDSFKNVSYWIANIQQHADDKIQKILVANKIDLVEERVVSTEEGEEVAEEYGLDYYETSAKDGTNVESMFFFLACEIVTIKEKNKHGQIPVPIDKEGKKRKWKYLKQFKAQEKCFVS